MKTLLRTLCLLAFFLSHIALLAQTRSENYFKRGVTPSMPTMRLFNESSLTIRGQSPEQNNNFPNAPLSPMISVPGATPLGISGKWYTQGVHGLHNIQVDPDNPNNIHAVVMTALNVTDNDTSN